MMTNPVMFALGFLTMLTGGFTSDLDASKYSSMIGVCIALTGLTLMFFSLSKNKRREIVREFRDYLHG